MKKHLLALTLLILPLSVRAEDYKSNTQGLDKRNFDMSTSPCTDFYQYANGSWMMRNPVPDEYSRWALFNEVIERNLTTLKDIAESASNSSHKKQDNNQKIGDFYASAMNVEQIEKAGITPLKPYLDKIHNIRSSLDLQKVVSEFHHLGLDSVFSVEVDSDLKNSHMVIAYFKQGGLGLPDRDYYTKTDADSKNIRQQYLNHLETVFKLMGYSSVQSQIKSQAVLSIETQLAEASLTRVEKRDPNIDYKMMTLQDAKSITPHFDWDVYFNTNKIPHDKKFSLATEKFFKTLDALIQNEPLTAWQSYLEWHLIKDTSPFLNTSFEQAHFNFFKKTLSGTKAMQPRWKRSLSAINTYLGEAMGQLFVEKTFPPEAKKSALLMIENIQNALKDRLENLSWMAPETKKQALKKLSTFVVKIGYPEKWMDYSDLTIKQDSYIENILRAKAFLSQDTLKKIGKPLDRHQWFMNPQDVNAYYNPTMNEIVFPAGILQPPFFDFKADLPVNYGAIGAVIGHEIMHGFDDQGSQFDAKGNLKNWWTEEDLAEFKKRTQVLIEQYNQFEALPQVFVNGELTIGENIGDLSGVTLAYAGLQNALKEKSDPLTDSLSFDQRFFLSWAQTWRNTITPQEMKLRINTDTHSPGKFRTNGVVRNIKAFQNAFQCSDSAPMVVPDEQKADLW